MRLAMLKVALFVLAVIGLFAWAGQLLPQFEEHPPAKRELVAGMPPVEIAAIGEELVRVKGGCLVCHKVTSRGNERGPDLREAFAKAGTRRPGMKAEAYLLESLNNPDAFIVPGYPRMMPKAQSPPANLNPAEIKAVVAYLQVLGGGEVTMQITPRDIARAKARSPANRGKALAEQHACIGCHVIEGEGGNAGPDITRIAASREPVDILRKILEPSIWTTPGYKAGIMPAELAKTIPEADQHEIVAYLARLAGKSYSPTGAASPWSHEGMRLGLVLLVFNLALLLAIALADRTASRRRNGV